MSTLTFPGDKPYPQEKYVTTLGVASSVIPDATDEPIKTTNDSEAQQAAKPAQLSLDTTAEQHGQHPLAQLGNARKNFLLGIFAVAYFVDVCNVSGVGIAVAQIGKDTGLSTSQFVWIITSYSLCFAAFLLFAGRLADLFPAQIIFEAGFLGLGVLSLITSFVTHSKYGFLILRGLGGICGSMTIPSAFHLLVHMFPDPDIQQAKLALLGLAGASGNLLGLVLAGLCMLANYRWFFRLMAIICIIFSILCVILLPYTGSTYKSHGDKTPRWKRMDIIGVLIAMGAAICFILGLTQGPIDGWGSTSFIAPFVLAFPLGVGFFVWESRIPPKSAILPSSIWKITNIIISSIVLLFPFSFWATSQLEYSIYFQEALHWSPIHVAAALLPQGIIGLIVGGAAQAIPQIITKPRYSIAIGGILMIVAEILQVYSNGGDGHKDYWRFCFPAYIIGSAAAIITFFASSINLITYTPPEYSGVAGAMVQTIAQLGGAIALAVQAGLQTKDVANWKQSGARSFWFMVAWVAVLSLQYVIFYRQPESQAREHELARQRMREANKDDAIYS